MFQDSDLKKHLEESSTIETRSLVVAEWNMNIATNIEKVGNYRFRPADADGEKFKIINNTFDPEDNGQFYTDATFADIVIDGGYDDNDTPTFFLQRKEKEGLLYSLEDCFGKFRPRSGINKIRFLNNSSQYSHNANPDMFRRPRYYVADKNDKFKYWSSYRKESQIVDGVAKTFERGIAQPQNDQFYIDDAAPFVKYKDRVPANRIVVKMQTGVGSVDLGPFVKNGQQVSDPLYGLANQQTPVRWKIQYLKDNSWIDAISFNENSLRSNGQPVIGPDGYVEISYGLLIPDQYKDIFIYGGQLSSETLLPTRAFYGQAFLVQSNPQELGVYYIWNGESFDQFEPQYGWYLTQDVVDVKTPYVTELTSTKQYFDQIENELKNREFAYISGIRVVAQTMNRQDSTLDIIEISPRLAVDLTDKVLSFSVTKQASDLGVSGMPVGQLLASNGSVTIFDYDQAFNRINEKSIVSKYLVQNVQIKFYDVVANVDIRNEFGEVSATYDYYVPLKTMYSEGFPEVDSNTRETTLSLRDLFFYFESLIAPEMIIPNVSLSYAIATVLDAIGFSNYVFKRIDGESDPVIPYFYIEPNISVAEVLNRLASSTQTAMFFDEYNNFVTMSKNYIMPTEENRPVDMVFYGSKDFSKNGIVKNNPVNNVLANIVQIASQENKVFNDGKIIFTERYIKKSVAKMEQTELQDRERNYIYEPVLLWEAGATETLLSQNNQQATQNGYYLAAISLNSSLTDSVPSVVNHQLINNTIDLGEGIYFIGRNNGYLYANGEIIRYDAVQYAIPGLSVQDGGPLVWVTNVDEYEKYFSKIPFNGKMYKTGLIRIYSEPEYETFDGITRLKNGNVLRHGRGQFGTAITNHYAGLPSYWSDNQNIRGCTMQSKYLFSESDIPNTPVSIAGAAGQVTGLNTSSNAEAQKTFRSNVIRNNLSLSFPKEGDTKRLLSTQAGTIQSSALTVTGKTFLSTEKPLDFISYIYKPLTNKFKHFGTRMRVVGSIENSSDKVQSAAGSTTYYTNTDVDPNKIINVSGGSGGIGVLINPETNNGYYLEIIALDRFDSNTQLDDIVFYKIQKDMNSTDAIPVKLWGANAQIIVDSGDYVGTSRRSTAEAISVYDLSVEYVDIGNLRRFFIYVNNKKVATVDDLAPLPVYNNMALFVRGESKCMFENIYAIANNYAYSTSFQLDAPFASAIATDGISADDSLKKYALSGVVQSTYLSGISATEPPKYNMYFEEFGTIMRECAYLDIKYDKAYPALMAQLSPSPAKFQEFVVSGFFAKSYGAEFLVFNTSDAPLVFVPEDGNYLRIQGITFTDESAHELSVDEYFAKKSDFSNPEFVGDGIVSSPLTSKKEYLDIKASRLTHGKSEFSLDAPYIQSRDSAWSMMEWMVSKVMKPRLAVGLEIFANPTVQLGDIVRVVYKDDDNVNQVVPEESRFVVYNIEYSKTDAGPQMNVYLSEVL